ncbi:glycosyltransferase family 4 protein [Geobacter sp.]|uniref:glycosyltransferase family 4 protein n=1 Tax=Geobacter sp. TaxID=46610 RepID=UPI00261FD5B6|nr:glycosyltransferase family 4 protein [Geobacter sp.]
MHYHKEMLQRLDDILPAYGYELVIVSGREKQTTRGRVALNEKIVRRQIEFDLTEIPVFSFTFRYQHGVTKIVKKLRPAVVITMCHSGTFSEWQILKLKNRINFKVIAWQCGYEYNPSRLKRWILSKFVPCFDHHLAYHTNAKHYAIAHGARPDQVTVMHNTINESAIECLSKETAHSLLEQCYTKLKGKKIVLYVGAVLEEKRLEVVFEALDILADPDLMFVLVGDGPHLDSIQQKFGQREDLVITGRVVDGVGPYFDAADVFILPGTGGLAINEAMAHGVAVISGYADGSADDLVVDGKNGFRLRNGNADEIATCLRNILSDPAVSRQMGEAGYEMIRGNLSFECFIDRVVGVLTASTNRGA